MKFSGGLVDPVGILLEILVETNLVRRQRILILAGIIDAVLAKCSVDIVAGNLLGSNGSVLNIGTEKDVGVLAAVEELELMPADEVPVTEIVIHDELAATAAANFPKEA